MPLTSSAKGSRRLPLPATFNSRAPAGICVWCAKELGFKNKDGSVNKVIRWHHDCTKLHREIADRYYQADVVEKRDGWRCGGCGKTHVRIVDAYRQHWTGRGYCDKPMLAAREFHDGLADYLQLVVGPFSSVRFWKIKLELEHKVPLWKVAHLPDPERWWYFTAANLWFNCAPCHKRKSAAEAAERAHFNRLEKERQAPQQPLIGTDGQRLI